jgi:hypothetical protein
MINKQETLKVALLRAPDKWEAGKAELIHFLIKIHDKVERSKSIKMSKKVHVINKKEDPNLVLSIKINRSQNSLAFKR